MQVQKLRLKRGWSQEELAAEAKLSVRVIRRIEAGEYVSPESLKAIAAVFGVDFLTLIPEQNIAPAANGTVPAQVVTENQEKDAFRHVQRLRGFYLYLLQYFLVVAILLLINLMAPARSLWAFWVMIGWVLGVFVHTSGVLRPDWLFGPGWERRQVEKYLGRSL